MKEMFLLKMKTHFLWNTHKKIFCLKELSRAISWDNCLGSNYLEGNWPGVIIRGAIIQVPIVRGQFFWRPLSWMQLSGRQLSRRKIVRGAIVLGSNCPGGNCPRTLVSFFCFIASVESISIISVLLIKSCLTLWLKELTINIRQRHNPYVKASLLD